MSSDSAIAEKKVREMASLTTGDSIGADVGMWSFAGETSEKFEAHVAKSVPLYLQGHDLVCKLSEFFVHPDSLIYEIGCSTAVLSRKLAEHHNKKSIRIVGIDIEPDMIARARSKCEAYDNIDLTSADAAHFEFEKSDLIVAYYTLQFVPPKKRQVLISALYNALNWGGALMMFEKTRAPDARFQDIMVQSYFDYKLDAGYTPDEIMGKSRSLKRVLEPFSTQGNFDLLSRAGFEDVMIVMKYLSFEGFLAIK